MADTCPPALCTTGKGDGAHRGSRALGGTRWPAGGPFRDLPALEPLAQPTGTLVSILDPPPVPWGLQDTAVGSHPPVTRLRKGREGPAQQAAGVHGCVSGEGRRPRPPWPLPGALTPGGGAFMCLRLSNTQWHGRHCGTRPGGGGWPRGRTTPGSALTGRQVWRGASGTCLTGHNPDPDGERQGSLKTEKAGNDPECLEVTAATGRGAVSTRSPRCDRERAVDPGAGLPAAPSPPPARDAGGAGIGNARVLHTLNARHAAH